MFKVIKCVGLGVMESPYEYYNTEYEFSSLKEAKEKAKELFISLVPKDVRNSSWCYENYFVEDSKGNKYY